MTSRLFPIFRTAKISKAYIHLFKLGAYQTHTFKLPAIFPFLIYQNFGINQHSLKNALNLKNAFFKDEKHILGFFK